MWGSRENWGREGERGEESLRELLIESNARDGVQARLTGVLSARKMELQRLAS